MSERTLSLGCVPAGGGYDIDDIVYYVYGIHAEAGLCCCWQGFAGKPEAGLTSSCEELLMSQDTCVPRPPYVRAVTSGHSVLLVVELATKQVVHRDALEELQRRIGLVVSVWTEQVAS